MRRRALHHGTRFGLLLQLAVGPVCLFVLQSGSERGVRAGLAAMAGVAAVDALYIAFAGLGVTRWAERRRARQALQYGGAVVIALFGLDLVVSAAGASLLPSVGPAEVAAGGAGVFLAAVVLTAANPLTIVFWAGVFAAKVAGERYGRAELTFFSLGCVLATVGFLTAVALVGALLGRVAPPTLLAVLNAVVGCALLYFAVRLARRRTAAE